MDRRKTVKQIKAETKLCRVEKETDRQRQKEPYT